jgi:hypothetical protein
MLAKRKTRLLKSGCSRRAPTLLLRDASAHIGRPRDNPPTMRRHIFTSLAAFVAAGSAMKLHMEAAQIAGLNYTWSAVEWSAGCASGTCDFSKVFC